MDPKKLSRILASRAHPRSALLTITGSDADLATDEEKELLEQVVDGKDPFEIRRRERKEDARDQSEGPVDIHFSSLLITTAGRSFLAREALLRQVGKYALHDVDPQFGKKNPNLHKFLMRVHHMLQEGKNFYEDVPEDPEGDIPAAPRDPVKYKFQSVYRALQEGMSKLRDHYRHYGEVHDKWVKLLQKRFKDFVPVYNRMTENRAQRDEDDGEQDSKEESLPEPG